MPRLWSIPWKGINMTDPTPFLPDSVEWQRFWTKVDTSGECWLWTGSQNGTGYGQITVGGNHRPRLVHRLSYAMHNGPIPEGLVIDQLCRVRLCVNPSHLEVVTTAENIRRGMAGEHQRIKTHCPQGHPYEGDNIYRIASRPNARYCRTCNNSKHVRKATP
jgi:hypothetical protein